MQSLFVVFPRNRGVSNSQTGTVSKAVNYLLEYCILFGTSYNTRQADSVIHQIYAGFTVAGNHAVQALVINRASVLSLYTVSFAEAVLDIDPNGHMAGVLFGIAEFHSVFLVRENAGFIVCAILHIKISHAPLAAIIYRPSRITPIMLPAMKR